jgi:hypothetical protein
MGPVVAALENVYYEHIDTAEVGGEPTGSAIMEADDPAASAPPAVPSSAPTDPSAPSPEPTERAHLDPPADITPPVSDPKEGEGVWQPVGTRVDGIPTTYATRVRADSTYTQYFASLMWLDTSLLKAMYVPGYQEPAGGPNPFDGALPKRLWRDVVANFNGPFRLEDAGGGYMYDGKVIAPMVKGRATTVIYQDGSIAVGKWGRDVDMTPDVATARQNLDLIVDKGRSQVGNGTFWGFTTDGESRAWRSAIGQRADGSIVYAGSPYLSATALADVMVAAGVKRAMTLDMNDWWTAGFYFKHGADGTPQCRKLDPAIQENCDRFLQRYKRDSYQFLVRR